MDQTHNIELDQQVGTITAWTDIGNRLSQNFCLDNCHFNTILSGISHRRSNKLFRRLLKDCLTNAVHCLGNTNESKVDPGLHGRRIGGWGR